MIRSSASHLFGPSARRPVAARPRAQHRPTRASVPSNTTPAVLRRTLLLLARLRRFLNGRIAAVIAQHEREAASWAQQRLDKRQFDSARIYRGPIDQVFSMAARKRAA